MPNMNRESYGYTSLGLNNTQTLSSRLFWQQRLIIFVLICFNIDLLSKLPIRVGPVSPTMLMELGVFILLFPWLSVFKHNLDRRDRFLLLVCLTMFILGFHNFSGWYRDRMTKLIFTSMYTYVMVICFFSWRPEFGACLRRLHLIPAYGLMYYATLEIWNVSGQIDLGERLLGNDLISYLAMITPICWVQFKRERGLWRVLNLFALGATVLVEIIVASRGGFICLVAATAFIMYMERPGTRVKIFTIALIMFFGILVYFPDNSAIKKSISSLKNPVVQLKVSRTPLWKSAIQSIKENPFLGGNFREDVFRLVLMVAPESRYGKRIRRGSAIWASAVHNGYLAVAADYGIIVAFLYIGFFVSMYRGLIEVRRMINDENNRKSLLAYMGTLFLYAIWMVPSNNYASPQLFLIWAIMICSMRNAIYEERLRSSFPA